MIKTTKKTSLSARNTDLRLMAKNLGRFIAENNWKISYDPESDSLSILEIAVSPEIVIDMFNDEIALYLDKNNKVKGIFIEYFTSNFLHSQEKLEALKHNLTKPKLNQPHSNLITLKTTHLSPLIIELQDLIYEELTIQSHNMKLRHSS